METNSSGALTYRNDYAPYGKRTQTLVSGTLPGKPKGYIDQRNDPASGLLYLNARYMDPDLGVFTQADTLDPLEAGVGTNRYAYALNNPVLFRDPSGTYVEIGLEIVSIGLGASSAWQNFWAGNYGAAAGDAIGVGVDIALAATPGAPRVIGLSRRGVDTATDIGSRTAVNRSAPNRGAQIALNRQNGAAFENQVVDALSHVGGTKNGAPVTVTLPSGKQVTTIPDLWGRNTGGILEVKNVQSLSNSNQLRAQLQLAEETGTPFNLVVSPRTQNISGPLRDRIDDVTSKVGGGVYRYDPSTGNLSDF